LQELSRAYPVSEPIFESWTTRTRSTSATDNTRISMTIRTAAHKVTEGRSLSALHRRLTRVMTSIRKLSLERQRQGNKDELLRASRMFHLEHQRHASSRYDFTFRIRGPGFESQNIEQYFLLSFKAT
jgi:hypothetical protein